MLTNLMDFSLATTGFTLFLTICGWLLAAVVVGAIIMGIFQAITQVQDNSLSFVGKVVAVGLVIYFTKAYFGAEILSFAKSIWGDIRNYK
jgi:flagellar biosynthetic protein FliQ